MDPKGICGRSNDMHLAHRRARLAAAPAFRKRRFTSVRGLKVYYPSPRRSLHRRPISSMSSRSRLPNSILCAVLVLRVLRVSRLACISSGVARRLYALASRYPWSPVVRAVLPAGGELTTVLPAGGGLTTFTCKGEVLD